MTAAFVEWLKLVQTGLAYMGLTIPMLGVQLLGFALALGCVWMFWRAQRAADNPFDAAQMFQDDRGRTALMKVLGFLAGLTSLWVIAFATVSGKLDWPTFIGWLSVMVLGKLGSDWLERGGGGTRPPADGGSSDGAKPRGGEGGP